MGKSASRPVIMALALAWSLFFTSVHAADWVLYDDFQNNTVDISKWVVGFNGPLNGETAVYEHFGKLHLLLRAYGNLATDQGTTGAQLRTDIRGQSPRGIMADIEIMRYDFAVCPENANGRVRTRIGAMFFNKGHQVPNSHENDIWAVIQLVREAGSTDPEEMLTAELYTFLCGDTNCNQGTTIETLKLGLVAVGQKVRLRLEWDPENNRIIGQLNDNPEQAIAYEVEDTLPPSYPTRTIQLSYSVPNGQCQERPLAFMHSTIHNVWVLP
mgnify:CR=1 FL=1|uniref:Uncharacterized protein n=1 Tax=Desulfacinum infernum TaxID=35837 RepID=A0A832A872_9BACT